MNFADFKTETMTNSHLKSEKSLESGIELIFKILLDWKFPQ